MRVVFFGSGRFAVPCLRWLVNSPHEIAVVVTQPDRPAGRGKRVVSTPVADHALDWALSVVRCPDVNQTDFIAQMRGLNPDLAIVIDFGQKLLAPLRSVFTAGCVNLHASLLPRYRGAAPVARAILNGEVKTGVSVFRLVDRMDAGPVLIRRETMIGPLETCADLESRLSRIGCDALAATMHLLEADPQHPGDPQDESQATLAPKLAKTEGYLRFDEPASKLALHCRAMWPWPGARCRYCDGQGRREDVTIAVATAIRKPAEAAPGIITPSLTIATSDGLLEVHSLQPAGKRLMSWKDFVNGRRVEPGHRMEPIE